MKNIHVLPTDKPSRLFVDIDDNKLKITQPLSGEYMMNQNIYITNDIEIKEGDCFLHPDNTVERASRNLDGRGVKKIILTTDQNLIKNGVQAIDDEFLEWFVKNPSCEKIEIKTRYLHSYKTGENFISFSKTPEFSSRNMQCIKIEPRYEIIIPQEEPKRKIDTCYNFDMEIGCVQDICRCEQEEHKQENCCTPANQIKRYVDCYGCDRKPKQEQEICNHCGKTFREQMKGCGEKTCYRQFLHKQETLEEAVKKLIKLNRQDAFYEGVKWQQEKQADFVIGFLEFIEGTYSYSNIFDHWYLHANTSKTYSKKQLLEVYLKRNKL